MYFFTADEHYGHEAILKYCHRPFKSVEEMNEEIIRRHNSLVGKNDIVVHAGDFCWANSKKEAVKYIKRLNGNHIFLRGCHDHWLPNSARCIWSKTIEGCYIVVCHYAMRTWARSHYNSWQLYGHSHGRLEPVGKQWDIGVDNNNFFPVSFEEIKTIMATQPDNFNYVGKKDGSEYSKERESERQ
ncbi:MAG: metallophosphoesterase family protein [Candidatus Thorarchaeota archaeon]